MILAMKRTTNPDQKAALKHNISRDKINNQNINAQGNQSEGEIVFEEVRKTISLTQDRNKTARMNSIITPLERGELSLNLRHKSDGEIENPAENLLREKIDYLKSLDEKVTEPKSKRSASSKKPQIAAFNQEKSIKTKSDKKQPMRKSILFIIICFVYITSRYITFFFFLK
jgi:hypothetical protein